MPSSRTNVSATKIIALLLSGGSFYLKLDPTPPEIQSHVLCCKASLAPCFQSSRSGFKCVWGCEPLISRPWWSHYGFSVKVFAFRTPIFLPMICLDSSCEIHFSCHVIALGSGLCPVLASDPWGNCAEGIFFASNFPPFHFPSLRKAGGPSPWTDPSCSSVMCDCCAVSTHPEDDADTRKKRKTCTSHGPLLGKVGLALALPFMLRRSHLSVGVKPVSR